MIRLTKVVRFNYRLAGEPFPRVATLQEYGTVHRQEPLPDAGGAVQVSVRVGLHPNERLVFVPLAADEFVS